MTGLVSTGTRILLGAFLINFAVASTALAQDLDLDALRSGAQTGDAKAQRTLGEALVYGIGGAEQDQAAGLRLLEQAAAGGDIRAKASLGKILLDGYYVPADPERAVPLLEEAVAAGNARAQAALGGALLWGEHLEADPARARVLLGQAAQSGDTEALRVLGEQLVGAWVFDRDVETGLPMLEQAVAKGDAKAKVALGSFLLYGTGMSPDPARALALFEEAAEAGNGQGLERYGAQLMWSVRNRIAAEEYLRRAGELGRGSAWTTLAEGAMYGYLAGRSRAKFDGYAEKARAAGEERIAVLEAIRRMWGISMRASGPGTIEILEQAAEAGNTAALKYLIALVRDGNHLNIRKEPDRAQAYLERFSELLTPVEVAQLALTIEAARFRVASAYPAMAAEYDSHPELKSKWFGEQLFAANENFAVYLLQADLARRGLYAGPVDGYANWPTLRALWRECMTLSDNARCADGALQRDVIGALLAR
ncbi:tetratricopeptide repeat protein [Actibacterium sp. MT2.3-13A]|uniref:tetratricopeptide repeat protein n=1 Tax=Actibacterium sp. MT2.3-13A TaxID=2828332 RepID=UPI001BA56AAF|nr:tetratricopeptide repeat protein [Actibacterium sp. MT2.3-13A]